MDAELLQYHTERAAMYGLLARLLNREVDQDLLKALAGLDFPTETGSELADKGNLLISSYLAGQNRDLRTELAVDYTRLFIVRTMEMGEIAYPFESVYTSETHVVMAEARDSVLSFYRKAGLDKSPGWNVGEDHIALELEFMQILNQRLVEACTNKDSDAEKELLSLQADFFNQHLLPWVPQFCDSMARVAQTDFYRGFALLLKAQIEADGQLFSA